VTFEDRVQLSAVALSNLQAAARTVITCLITLVDAVRRSLRLAGIVEIILRSLQRLEIIIQQEPLAGIRTPKKKRTPIISPPPAALH
jgi:hypothetical protein